MASDLEKVHKSSQPKPLTKKQESTALLVADDRLTDEKIAEQAGVTRRCLAKWKKDVRFIAAVEAHKAAWRERVMSTGIADKAVRLAQMDDRYNRLNRVIDARAERYSAEIDAEESGINALAGDEDEDGNKVPKPRIPPEEARTGVIIETVIYTKEGARTEWATDNALLSEIRNLEKEAAAELGQRVVNVKSEQTVRGVVAVAPVDLTKLSVEQLKQIEAMYLEAGIVDRVE